MGLFFIFLELIFFNFPSVVDGIRLVELMIVNFSIREFRLAEVNYS